MRKWLPLLFLFIALPTLADDFSLENGGGGSSDPPSALVNPDTGEEVVSVGSNSWTTVTSGLTVHTDGDNALRLQFQSPATYDKAIVLDCGSTPVPWTYFLYRNNDNYIRVADGAGNLYLYFYYVAAGIYLMGPTVYSNKIQSKDVVDFYFKPANGKNLIFQDTGGNTWGTFSKDGWDAVHIAPSSSTPSAPSTGVLLYFDSTANELRAINSAGTIKTLATW